MRHSDGSIGYCCVMGAMGEHLAMAVYPGDEGMYSYRLMGVDRTEMNDFEIQEMALSQNCVMISFENKNELRPREAAELNHYCTAKGIALRGKKACPQFQRFQPHYYPWYVDDERDQTHLAEALEAALAVSDSLAEMTAEERGFTEGAPFDRMIPLLEKKDDGFEWGQIALPKPKKLTYPSPEFHDDITLMKLAKSKKRGAEWACDVLMHVDVMTDEKSEDGYVEKPKNAPFYPYLLLILDTKSEMVLTVQLADDPADYSESFARTILDAALNHSSPSEYRFAMNGHMRCLSACLGNWARNWSWKTTFLPLKMQKKAC